MLLKIRHGLLEITNSSNKSSAIIINNNFIIASSTILESYFIAPSPFFEDIRTKLLDKLSTRQLVKVQEDGGLNNLKSLKFEITFDQRKLEDRSRVLTRYSANLLYIFNCIEIRECFESILKKLNGSDSSQHSLKPFFHSSFLILNLHKNDEEEKPNIIDFIRNMITYCRYLPNIKKMDEVMTICTPFGLENFYKTINFGKISNVLGHNDCLFVLSNSLPSGCEGSAVFNNKLRLIGLLVCTTLHKDCETINLTMSANFRYVFKNFALQFGINFAKNINSTIQKIPTWEKSLVVIICEGSQGTGTFVKVLNRKFILTCSHVILNDDNTSIVNCRYIDGKFSSEIIWKNPNYNEPFDIALLTVPEDLSDDYFVPLSDTKPFLGQSIYNAGFPFFTNFNIDGNEFTPGIFEGRIIKRSPGVIISDGTLQSGQSGGPMFADNGTVLGICVSNLKLDKTVYPNINTSIPICDIKRVIERFAKSNDVTVLNDLVAPTEVKKIWALETPFIDCKL